MVQDKDNFDDVRQRKRALDDALSKYETKNRAEGSTPPGAGAALGEAFKLSATFVVTVLVGVALGWGLGALTGFRAAGMIAGLVLGIAAGFREVIRAAHRMQARAEAAPDKEAERVDEGQ